MRNAKLVEEPHTASRSSFSLWTSLYLLLLFLSSLGEAYFPEIMVINMMTSKANYLFLADALGNALPGILPTKLRWRDTNLKMALVPAIVDLVSKVFLLGGIALSSAQKKAILYNSCIVWSAFLSRCVLSRSLSLLQWVGVFILIVGCTLNVDWSVGESGSEPILGVVFILIGCVLHSLTNVVNEHYIRKYDFPPSRLCCLIGTINFSLWTIIYSFGYIIPETVNKKWVFERRDFSFETLQQSVRETGMSNLIAFLLFVACSAVHAIAYFNLLGSIGNVSSGVMKGLTTACYVALSATLFCHIDRKYCATLRTVSSSIVCIIGVLLYSYATKQASRSVQLCHEIDAASKSGIEVSREP